MYTCVTIYLYIYIYIYIYITQNSEVIANYWVEKKQRLSSSTRLIIREWKIIIQLYNKYNRQLITLYKTKK